MPPMPTASYRTCCNRPVEQLLHKFNKDLLTDAKLNSIVQFPVVIKLEAAANIGTGMQSSGGAMRENSNRRRVCNLRFR